VRPDIIFKWFLLIVFVVLVTLAFLDYLFRSAPAFESFLGSYKGIIISLGTLLVILLATMLTTHLSNVSAEKRQEADRLLNAELKLSDFRQAWIDVLRADCSEVVSLSYSFFDEPDNRMLKLAKLKGLEAHIRLRLNPLEDAETERNIEKSLIQLISALEAAQKKDSECSKDIEMESGAIEHREHFAELSAQLLKKEWEVLKDNLDKLKAGL
tara:strand:+ start:5232 stop:5867 length:636 start_codon:yes stop_codon:yes gene_type:complete